jgi:hypothetical protein
MNNNFSIRFKSVFKNLILLIIIFSPILLWAQDDIEMADTMRSNGKIYVVVGVVSIILAGILIYLMRIDQRLRKLEKEGRKV